MKRSVAIAAASHRQLRCVAMAVLTALCLVTAAAAATQSANGLEAFVGRWQINPAKTIMGRAGPNGQNIARSSTFTWIFAPDGPGLRWEIFAEYPEPAPTRTMALIPNGKLRPCLVQGSCLSTGGDARDQTYAHYRMDGHMLTRVFYVKGQVSEYNTYAVSADGKTFTTMSWSPASPEYQNIQVFDRQP